MIESNPNTTRCWPRCIILLILIVVIIVIWCRFLPFPCILCPEESTTTAAQIVIDDARVATWMVMDNQYLDKDLMDGGTKLLCSDSTRATGSCSTTYARNAVHGVMFQLGSLIGSDNSGNPTWTQTLKNVEFYKEGEVTPSETLNPGEFDWLDVSPFGECIIDAYHAYALFDNSKVALDCDQPDWDSCRRNRALHAALKPDLGLLTYWAGNNDYTAEAELRSGSDFPSYTFNLGDPVHIDVWLGGCFQRRLDDVTEIRVVFDTTYDTPDNIFDDPPTNGVHTFP